MGIPTTSPLSPLLRKSVENANSKLPEEAMKLLFLKNIRPQKLPYEFAGSRGKRSGMETGFEMKPVFLGSSQLCELPCPIIVALGIS
jgi:hypothetical protein